MPPSSGTSNRGRKSSVRTPRHKNSSRASSSSRRQSRLSWQVRLILIACLLVAGLMAWGAIARFTAPVANTSLSRFDAIIVLGVPADPDGNPTPLQLSRVTEGVHEYERGVASHIIFTGGATRPNIVEAEVMARTARAEGIPESAILVEPHAMDTIQNACYSVRIMKARGWRSAEVVSTVSHLRRAGLIFERLPIEWRTHAAPEFTPDDGIWFKMSSSVLETVKTVRYLVWARQMEQCEP